MKEVAIVITTDTVISDRAMVVHEVDTTIASAAVMDTLVNSYDRTLLAWLTAARDLILREYVARVRTVRLHEPLKDLYVTKYKEQGQAVALESMFPILPDVVATHHANELDKDDDDCDVQVWILID